jgi:hypothetical protein
MSNIKVGDLVMVVKPAVCCGSVNSIGRIFPVEGIERVYGQCAHCGMRGHEYGAKIANGRYVLLTRIIKIDPPALPESLEREKELSV